jgi:hypothetical protein
VIHFVDPAFDLGFSMTHLLSKAHHLRAYRAGFAEAALLYWQTYRRRLGDARGAEDRAGDLTDDLADFTKDLETAAVRHTLGCMLARVAGRSPLEYLDDAERARQRDAVVALMQDEPRDLADLIDRFVKGL